MNFTIQDVLSFINNTSESREYTFNFVNSAQTVVLNSGIYSFECWGASGCSYYSKIKGGKGAYVFGKIRIDSKRKFYVYVAPEGKSYNERPFGGGGWGDLAGGGSSDIRLIKGDSFESLKSRLIIAAGGGGSDSLEGGGSGGALEGKNSQSGYSKGASQTEPGTGFLPGEFGVGGGIRDGTDRNGGGGGGYYGGGSGKTQGNYGGSGGSSFISGHFGCDAIFQNSTKEKIYHTGRPFHYSGFVFYDTLMIDGDSLMPGIASETQTGNEGNGFVRIRLISRYLCHGCTCRIIQNSPFKIVAYIFILKS